MGDNFAVMAAGLITYDFMITFSKEVGLFWRLKFTLSSILFLVNRYVPLVVSICEAFVWATSTLEVFQYLPWAVFSGLRAYVLSSRAWPLAVLVFILSLAPLLINYVTLGYGVPYIDPVDGCGATGTLTDAVQQDCMLPSMRLARKADPTLFSTAPIVSRACLIASDLLVLAITWSATYRNSRELKSLGHSTSLSSIFFRDGVIYFIVLLIVNVLHLSFSLRSILNEHNTTGHASYIARLTEAITAVLISRFLINLQEANNGKYHQHSLSSIQIGSLDFNRFVGSLSSSLAAPGETSSEHSEQHPLYWSECAAKGDGRTRGQTTDVG